LDTTKRGGRGEKWSNSKLGHSGQNQEKKRGKEWSKEEKVPKKKRWAK